MSEPRVILLEFNELSPALMLRFIEQGRLPNFARLYRSSQVYITDAHERYPFLEPWIQWVTVHTGLSREAHGVQRLADGVNLTAKRLWDYAVDAGRTVWVCGSMNAHYQLPLSGQVLPDPWSARLAPFPESLAPYYDFVRQNVQEHSNRGARFGWASYAAFLRFMATHGLSVGTVVAIVRQLLGERLRTAPHWRRATVMDRLQWDVFQHEYRRLRPQLATFFLNSTAHLQHQFWRDMSPDAFPAQGAVGAQQPGGKPNARAGAILFGYQQMDRLVGKSLDLCDADTTLVLLSALSQEACADFDAAGGKLVYRPKSFDKLLAALGVDEPCRTEATMAEQFRLQFSSADDALRAAEKIKAPTWQGQQAFNAKPNGSLLYCGCRIHQKLPADARLEWPAGRSAPFFELLYQVEALKSGKHHPDGIFWICRPGQRHKAHPEKVPLECVAPTVLDLLGVTVPPGLSGQSVLSAPAAAAPAAAGA